MARRLTHPPWKHLCVCMGIRSRWQACTCTNAAIHFKVCCCQRGGTPWQNQRRIKKGSLCRDLFANNFLACPSAPAGGAAGHGGGRGLAPTRVPGAPDPAPRAARFAPVPPDVAGGPGPPVGATAPGQGQAPFPGPATVNGLGCMDSTGSALGSF